MPQRRDPRFRAQQGTVAIVVLGGLVFVDSSRISGKRTIKQGTAFELVLALIFGGTVDDVVWDDVSVSTFVVALASLLFTSVISYRAR
jgi:uncharacterized membrane protein YcaP (DUF421 family)